MLYPAIPLSPTFQCECHLKTKPRLQIPNQRESYRPRPSEADDINKGECPCPYCRNKSTSLMDHLSSSPSDSQPVIGHYSPPPDYPRDRPYMVSPFPPWDDTVVVENSSSEKTNSSTAFLAGTEPEIKSLRLVYITLLAQFFLSILIALVWVVVPDTSNAIGPWMEHQKILVLTACAGIYLVIVVIIQTCVHVTVKYAGVRLSILVFLTCCLITVTGYMARVYTASTFLFTALMMLTLSILLALSFSKLRLHDFPVLYRAGILVAILLIVLGLLTLPFFMINIQTLILVYFLVLLSAAYLVTAVYLNLHTDTWSGQEPCDVMCSLLVIFVYVDILLMLLYPVIWCVRYCRGKTGAIHDSGNHL